jgi:porin
MVILMPHAAYGDASNEELEQRIERLEKKDAAEKEAEGEKSAMDRVSLNGVMAGAYQYQKVDDAPEAQDTGRGAFVFQPEIGIAITDNDEVFAKFGFAAGNMLNKPIDDGGQAALLYVPWGADLEDDVKDINGRNRDYLLTAWYKHNFEFSEDHTLGITGGLIDATDYLDENAYANDEFGQFMNEVFVNAPIANLQSYDAGGAIEWECGNFFAKGAVMGVGDNDYDRSFTFYGATLGYILNTSIGEGNYRVTGSMTSEAFDNPEEDDKEKLASVVLSFDQQLGEILGAWLRIGMQDDDAAVDAEKFYSGGIDVNGKLWGREGDNIGIAYALLDDGNVEVESSKIFEAYFRLALLDFLGITADFQWQENDYKSDDDPSGYFYGLRGTVEW